MLRSILAIALLAAAEGCPPAPVPPDSGTDASPPALFDAAVAGDGAPLSPCASACAQMALFCGPQLSTCEYAMRTAQTDKLIRGGGGAPLTCACIAKAQTKAAVVDCGVGCK